MATLLGTPGDDDLNGTPTGDLIYGYRRSPAYVGEELAKTKNYTTSEVSIHYLS